MLEEQTILLIDSEKQIFVGLQILPKLFAELPQYGATLQAAADIQSAMKLLEAVDVDLAVIAGDAQELIYAEIITSPQRCYPGLVVIALIEGHAPCGKDENILSRRFHRCLHASLGAEELVRVICEEAWKLAEEKRSIAGVLAGGNSRERGGMHVRLLQNDVFRSSRSWAGHAAYNRMLD